ncbi:hypothetical protein SEA_GREKAYCON_17 [Arthrobacter phage Grekaycon]|uniref:Tail assembly chaperone n=3 Tax=Marthavirus martha TaxID=1980950 RepID=A0A514A5G6_9CAUD|nr:tail assembly chaperone [Arthrobacter phage Martha]ALY09670.1 hypothetical protein MARTHA_17 [Arthrobacter phage Martha]KUR65797.1 hypothetical protein JM67_03310 [Arthrobacter sp. ATCC 21022]QDH48507.1 hypothetical protein SEA_GREKAYCON_17 [Arthrobacter phage Grekaycon]QED11755.1 hypothetical protein SEA_BOSSLADY_17 [Arthrobacter phage BossLady]
MTEVFGTAEAPAADEFVAYDTPAEQPRRRAAEPVEEKQRSVFDELKEEAAKELDKFVIYQNKLRPAFFMKFKVDDLDAKDLKRYERHTLGTGKRRNPENADLIKGNAVMLADKCVAIMKGGVEDSNIMADDDGDLTFTSNSFVDAFADDHDVTVQSAIQKFLGDAQIMKIAGALLDEAGYGDEAEAVTDPHNG